MEGPKTKMGRNPSSLIRSPTLQRIQNQYLTDETRKNPRRPVSAAAVFVTVIALVLFYYSPFIALAAAVVFAVKRLVFSSATPPAREPTVEWFIGEERREVDCEAGESVREAVEVYGNGDCYEGEFYRGKCSGSGVYSYVRSGKYEGEWVEGKYDGHGVESWGRGSRYRGQYRRGLRHGVGVYRFYAGDCYAGEWVSGQSHGLGVQSCSDGSWYVGEFKCGVKHGLGSYHFRNGDKYAGEYFGDKIHGFGVYEFANGHRYEGSWHEGRKQGLGAYTFRNGEVKSGQWDNGILMIPQSASHAVEAARGAAERAAKLPPVEERVARAVAAANRAATAARVAAIKAVQNQMNGRLYVKSS